MAALVGGWCVCVTAVMHALAWAAAFVPVHTHQALVHNSATAAAAAAAATILSV